ncbi:hypothetical protein AB1Y20_023518 [Prymnesium parvum]|uniref:Calpain catalytic domain-containing protein n=1 Tax=Prymnesium parvum TaxID=97485 RepID=A0AB34JE55_PRYPA
MSAARVTNIVRRLQELGFTHDQVVSALVASGGELRPTVRLLAAEAKDKARLHAAMARSLERQAESEGSGGGPVGKEELYERRRQSWRAQKDAELAEETMRNAEAELKRLEAEEAGAGAEEEEEEEASLAREIAEAEGRWKRCLARQSSEGEGGSAGEPLREGEEEEKAPCARGGEDGEEARRLAWRARKEAELAAAEAAAARAEGEAEVREKARPMEEKARPMEEKARPMEEKARPMEEKARPMEEKARPMEEKARPMEEKARPMEEKARPMEEKARPMEEKARPMEEKARPMEEKARPLPAAASDEASASGRGTPPLAGEESAPGGGGVVRRPRGKAGDGAPEAPGLRGALPLADASAGLASGSPRGGDALLLRGSAFAPAKLQEDERRRQGGADVAEEEAKKERRWHAEGGQVGEQAQWEEKRPHIELMSKVGAMEQAKGQAKSGEKRMQLEMEAKGQARREDRLPQVESWQVDEKPKDDKRRPHLEEEREEQAMSDEKFRQVEVRLVEESNEDQRRGQLEEEEEKKIVAEQAVEDRLEMEAKLLREAEDEEWRQRHRATREAAAATKEAELMAAMAAEMEAQWEERARAWRRRKEAELHAAEAQRLAALREEEVEARRKAWRARVEAELSAERARHTAEAALLRRAEEEERARAARAGRRAAEAEAEGARVAGRRGACEEAWREAAYAHRHAAAARQGGDAVRLLREEAEAEARAWRAAAARALLGAEVELCALRVRPELNGRRGVVEYQVRLASGQAVALRPTNLLGVEKDKSGELDSERAQDDAAAEEESDAFPAGGPAKPADGPADLFAARQAVHEHRAAEGYAAVLRDCKRRGRPLIDPSFPPLDRSLYLNSRDWAVGSNQHRAAALGALQWVRAPEVIWRDDAKSAGVTAPLQVFRGAPLPTDVLQGALGDCWLLSALASLAERPELLAAVVRTPEVNAAGAYQVRLCVDGEWKTLLLDDLIPCTSDRQPAFASGARRQLWVPLIEKAFAKLHGCYEALEGGTTDEALAALTGFPCERVAFKRSAERRRGVRAARPTHGQHGVARAVPADEGDEGFDLEVVWARILGFHEAGYLMTASIGQGSADGADASLARAMGLLSEHAYSLLQVRTVRGGAARLIQLRNPWGKMAWAGDWSDGSSLWTPALQAELRPRKEEGVFWMEWRDFTRFFDAVDVCRVRPRWAELRMRSSLALPSQPTTPLRAFILEVPQTSDAEFTLMQRFTRASARRTQGDMLLLLLRCRRQLAAKGSSLEPIDSGAEMKLLSCSERSNRGAVNCQALLSKGSYLMLPISLRPSSKPPLAVASRDAPEQAAERNVVVRVGSAKPMKCDAAQVTLRDGLAALAAYCRRGQRRDVFDGMSIYTLQDGQGQLTFVENRAAGGATLTIALDNAGSTNVSPTRGALQTVDVLSNGCGQLVQVNARQT